MSLPDSRGRTCYLACGYCFSPALPGVVTVVHQCSYPKTEERFHPLSGHACLPVSPWCGLEEAPLGKDAGPQLTAWQRGLHICAVWDQRWPLFPADTAQDWSGQLRSRGRSSSAPRAGLSLHHHPHRLPPHGLPSPRAQCVPTSLLGLHPASSCAPSLPPPLPQGVHPLLACLQAQEAWGQFTDDQKHKMCFKVLQCHPGEEGKQHRPVR